jgi:hypothetical protein
VGDFNLSTTYKPGQIIRYEGKLYNVIATVTGHEPPETSYYSLYLDATVQETVSTQNKALEINDAIIAEAEANTPKSGYETRQFYTLTLDKDGYPALITVDDTTSPPDASSTRLDVSRIMERPLRQGYPGYLVGDGVPENGVDFGFGTDFPRSAIEGDYFLRTDYKPNRLFRYSGKRWVKREDNIRHTLTNTDTRSTLKTSFINNSTVTEIDGEMTDERQAISKVFRPRADL